MNALKRKLTSQSGASITYALLLFLVCAVVSSVVLAAGTAASGRMSQSVESDQRYYAVTSAAEFLKKQLEFNGQSWIRKVVDAEGQGSLDDGIVSGGLLDTFSGTVVGVEGYSCPKSFTINAKDHEELKVNVNAKLEASDPVLTLTLSNADTSDGTFSIEMVFTADKEIRKGKDASSKTVTVQKVTWHLYSISTIVASEPTPST